MSTLREGKHRYLNTVRPGRDAMMGGKEAGNMQTALTALMQEYDAEERPYRWAMAEAATAARASGRYDAAGAAWEAWSSIWPTKYHPRLVAALAADPSLYGAVLAELQSDLFEQDIGTCRAVYEEMITLHPELIKMSIKLEGNMIVGNTPLPLAELWEKEYGPR
jgi:hypothetical protein